ncbi:hypothetical protein [Caenispirillum bisanense]|uniref:Uncharacterized protein n=1 Tax=Caenispirillum bisanense TaxID=414052 RepID=A0A286GSS0_9PROT|nr:hypothetical protein [Caenispirillum bisanense]SOD98560.1 hypothetical protein SAMN05421508_1089 [Caenispirillum bisanense]
MPKSYLSDADKAGMSENCAILAESLAAGKAGDEEAAWQWLALAELPAHSLMSAKKLNGADWVRAKGLRTETAEKVYGKDWLDRDH